MITHQQYFDTACDRELRRRLQNYRQSCKNSYQADHHDELAELRRIANTSSLGEKPHDEGFTSSEPVISLWHNLWHRGEMACLFGDTNVGKTLLTNQIANDLATSGKKVLYVDFENPEMHFINHYKDAHYTIWNHPNIRYVGINGYADPSAAVTIEKKFEGIIDQILLFRTPYVIIDDISHILPAKFSNKSIEMLQRLRNLALTWHISILVLAHTRYHNPSKPLSISNLAGSREFAFSFDTIFAINKITNSEVTNDPEAAMPPTHYIRQFKTRSTPILYDEDNAMRLSLGKYDGIVCFKIVDAFGIEAQLITPITEISQEEIVANILALHAKGVSIRKIAQTLATTPTIVFRTLQSHKPTPAPSTPSVSSVSSVSSVPSVSIAPEAQSKSEEGDRQQAHPSAPSAPSVSSVSSTEIPSLLRGAEDRLSLFPKPLQPEIQNLVEKSGMQSIIYPYFQKDTPFQELFKYPQLLEKNRFTFIEPNYYKHLIQRRLTTHHLSFQPSASLTVYNHCTNNPLMRCGSLIYNPNFHQLGTLDYTSGRLNPFPHTFPENTTITQLNDAIQSLYTLRILQSQQSEAQSEANQTQLSNKIANLKSEITAIIPEPLHHLILPTPNK